MPAGVMNGILTRIGIPSTIQLLILVTSIDYVSVSTLMIFENRFYLLNSKKKWWKRIRPLWMIVNFSLAPLHQIPNILEFPDQKFARELVINWTILFLFITGIIIVCNAEFPFITKSEAADYTKPKDRTIEKY
ncbi:hypothetical protein L5515_006852 [Caenorhabditis briggsae]|uniref:Uncharacterized protein n=1 Tax=Caenorhabditis briggsae TaxID=6238 RepID=A0AAE9F2Z2_CAEBR|nr:hypothetical protein L5515_006852 [Caenorhabditis briggsae]